MPDGNPADLSAADLVAATLGDKPRLLLEPTEPDVTVEKLREVLAGTGTLFDRGMPVRLAYDQVQGCTIAHKMTPALVVLETHRACRPYQMQSRNDSIVEVNTRLPIAVASMYLDWQGEWKLPPLNGIATAPLLRNDGTVRHVEGYDETTGMWCENIPDLAGLVPTKPTKAEAEAALLLIRKTFATFCFADAQIIRDPQCEVPLVNVTKPPGKDESGFLAALLTAVCRPSLHLAPGVILRAAPMSGAGSGKGLLARCICIIAFGRDPHAVTAGGNAEELEKRISAELIEGSSTLFLDNLNNVAFKSDLLASAITERPSRVRILGESRMVQICANSFIILTGNGLSISEDMARRLVCIELDAGTEDPEARKFTGDIRNEVKVRRAELLGACLTIWRWGRQTQGIKRGKPLGNFDQWCAWVRDPLLDLGCNDPASRVTEAKKQDPRRQAIADLFAKWWERHAATPVAIKDLHHEVLTLADPQGRGRQFLAAFLGQRAGTRLAGFLLNRQQPAGQWGAATYSLQKVLEAPEHRDHRDHRGDTEQNPPVATSNITPMPPMPQPVPHDAESTKVTSNSLKDNGRDPMPPMTPMLSPRRDFLGRPGEKQRPVPDTSAANEREIAGAIDDYALLLADEADKAAAREMKPAKRRKY